LRLWATPPALAGSGDAQDSTRFTAHSMTPCYRRQSGLRGRAQNRLPHLVAWRTRTLTLSAMSLSGTGHARPMQLPLNAAKNCAVTCPKRTSQPAARRWLLAAAGISLSSAHRMRLGASNAKAAKAPADAEPTRWLRFWEPLLVPLLSAIQLLDEHPPRLLVSLSEKKSQTKNWIPLSNAPCC